MIDTQEMESGEFVLGDDFQNQMNQILNTYSPKTFLLSSQCDSDIVDLLKTQFSTFPFSSSSINNSKTSKNHLENQSNVYSSLNPPSIQFLKASTYQPSLYSTIINGTYSSVDGYIDRNQIERNSQLTIHSLSTLTLSTYMYMEPNAYSDLQIFSVDFHPSVIKGKGKEKEGFSLFSLMDRTKTPAGMRLLKQWMSSPLCDKTKILYRQQMIQYFLQSSFSALLPQMSPIIAGIKDISRIILRIKTVQAKFTDWISLYHSLSNILHFGEILSLLQKYNTLPIPESLSIITKWPIILRDSHVILLHNLLEKTIDISESILKKRVVIQIGIDSTLDQHRYLYSQLEELLDEQRGIYTCKYPQLHMLLWNFLFIPKIGYVASFAVTSEEKPDLPQEFEYIFTSDSRYYYKCDYTRKMDKDYGDIYATIIDLEAGIKTQMEDRVLELESLLIDICKITAEIDVLLAYTSVSRDYNLVCPIETEDSVVYIKGSRHILQELTVDQFITNDIYIDSRKGSLQILTGPNYSGKSVYLKQIGLLVYMNQIGMYIPAERAVMGIMKRLYTKMSLMETCSDSNSAFTSDVKTINRMLGTPSAASLLLIDEFGKGTLPADGIALFGSLVNYFASLSPIPTVILTTHYTQYLQHILPSNISSILYIQMQVFIEDDASTDVSSTQGASSSSHKAITPLFRVVPGICNDSYGIYCAQIAGVPAGITDRAKDLLRCIENDEPIEALTTLSPLSSSLQSLLKEFMTIKDWKTLPEEQLNQFLNKLKQLEVN
ncbi:hypothetical protein WA158_005041 [Blastocystis sp. Blastoise]